jgi:hypothetical protein
MLKMAAMKKLNNYNYLDTAAVLNFPGMRMFHSVYKKLQAM